MGALHVGHVSLIEKARAECGFVVVSIFVNPTQFGPNEDFNRYPRPRETDLQICGDAGADLVFYPTVETMYPTGHRTFVEVAGLSDILEGAIRPGHFRGVATVVTKLFNIVQPRAAVFGKKDYQQLMIVRRLVEQLALPLRLTATRPLDEAISSAGGVDFAELDANLMLHQQPGVFCAGEMLDWEAPTGGYLLTACLATGVAAGRGAANYLGR